MADLKLVVNADAGTTDLVGGNDWDDMATRINNNFSPSTYVAYLAGTTLKIRNGITGIVDYTADNTVDAIPALQSAYDNIKNVGSDSADIETGGVINILKGTYKCVTSLEISSSRSGGRRGVQLRGEGRGTLLNFVPTSSLPYGLYIKSDYAALRDFAIQGNANTVELVRATSSTTHYADRVNIFNVQFRGTNAWASLVPITGQIGIRRDASTAGNIKLYWWKIIGCSFDSLDWGIKGTGGANDTSMQIEACDFYDCTTGIELYANQHIINNVYFQGDLDYGVTGVHVLGTSSENIITNVVHELRVTATNCQGVLLDSGSSRNRISNVYSGYNNNTTVVSVRDNSANGTNVIAPYIYSGAAAVTKPTAATVLTDSLWFETDTKLWYAFNGTSWSAMATSLVGGTTLNFNELTATNITEIKGSDTSGLTIKGNTDVTSATARNIILQTLNTATDTQTTALTINGTGPIISLGTTLDINDKTINNVPNVRGSDTSGLTIRGNTATTAATEKNVVLQTLNAATDAFVDALTVTANGANPTVTLLNAILANSTITTPVIKYTDVSKVNTDSPYSILTTDRIIRLNATSGAITATLPTAVGVTGKKYDIRRVDVIGSSNMVSITTTSSQTIGSAPNWFLWPGEFVTVESDGANWEVIAEPSRGMANYYMLKGTSADRYYAAGNFNLFDGASSFLTSTTSPTLNTLYAYPIVVAKATKFDRLTFRITTNSTAGNSRAGIYRDSGNCYPGALVFDSGSIDTTSGGGAAPVTKNTTITAGLQILPPGLYWLVYEQDTSTGQMLVLGTRTVYGIAGGQFGSNTYGWSVAHTFGALPDPYTAGGTGITTTPAVGAPQPAVFMRAV